MFVPYSASEEISMNAVTDQKQRFTISVHEPEEASGAFIFTIAPNGLQKTSGPNGKPKRVPQFVVAVRQVADELTFDWGASPDEPGSDREAIQAEIGSRLKDRTIWIDRVSSLVGQIEQWAKELGWSTRRIEKGLEDLRIGKHRLPALLMQDETRRILLEPVGRTTPGAEGVVDLYLMPAYDDIARLYFCEDRWNVHYMFANTKPTTTVRETDPLPLSKETLEKVLSELRQEAFFAQLTPIR
jgi:hypothetical protein